MILETESRRPNDEFLRRYRARNFIAFWLFGLTNNFAYVVMLSAAHDILSGAKTNTTMGNVTFHPDLEFKNLTKNRFDCNSISTGAILLADILPSLSVKILAPFFVFRIPYYFRILLVVFFQAVSFPIVAYSNTVGSLFGVACASFSTGFGEYSFLQLASYYESNMISTWSSGTGAAGVFGSLSYAGLIRAGLAPRTTLLIMIISPLVLFVSYFFILVKPSIIGARAFLRTSNIDNDDAVPIITTSRTVDITSSYTWREKVKCIWGLRNYMIPLGAVYVCEYFINQGLHELLYFPKTSPKYSHKEQYRWYQVDYQIGVLFSRSSVNCFKIKYIWVLAALQFCNVGVFLSQVLGNYFPDGQTGFWILLCIIFYEGLLGGAAYVNTFYRIVNEVPEEKREFSIGAVSLADSLGIATAGVIAMPIHNYFCSLNS